MIASARCIQPAGPPTSLAGAVASKEGRARPKARARAPWMPMAASPSFTPSFTHHGTGAPRASPAGAGTMRFGFAAFSVRCSMGCGCCLLVSHA